MTEYNKNKDLAHILIEGTKVVYGKERSAKLQSEFERQQRLPVYRGKSEELTEIVDRVCGPEIIDAQYHSIDDAVELRPKPSMVKVALKTTKDLINKTCWYYPLLGALPSKYQDRIAEKFRDNPGNYFIANLFGDMITTTGLGAYYFGIGGGFLGFMASCIISTARTAIAKEKNIKGIGGPTLLLPLYATVYPVLAISKIARASWQENLQQEQQKLLLPPNKKKKIRIEEQKPEVVDEEFDEEAETAEKSHRLRR